MTASYKCNGCNAPIERGDAGHAMRELDGVRIDVYANKISDDRSDTNDPDFHLCVKCLGKVLAEGVAPKPTDEIPF